MERTGHYITHITWSNHMDKHLETELRLRVASSNSMKDSSIKSDINGE
jgi:hypothetical protein